MLRTHGSHKAERRTELAVVLEGVNIGVHRMEKLANTLTVEVRVSLRRKAQDPRVACTRHSCPSLSPQARIVVISNRI
jgi:hypothetical protein